MSIGLDDVSELRPLTGLLLNLQVIHEHGQQSWCNDIDRGKFLIHTPELYGHSTSSHLAAKQEELTKDINFDLQIIYFILRRVLQHMGPMTLLHLRWKACYRFQSPLKIHRPQPGFNRRTLRPMARTLTTTQPRATINAFIKWRVLRSTSRKHHQRTVVNNSNFRLI
jgi:hypothetical protein